MIFGAIVHCGFFFNCLSKSMKMEWFLEILRLLQLSDERGGTTWKATRHELTRYNWEQNRGKFISSLLSDDLHNYHCPLI